MTNSEATTTETIKTNAWGDRLDHTSNPDLVTTTSEGYTGHKYDQNSDLTYAHARYLSTGNKTWLSEDPMALENFTNSTWLSNPQAQNSYSYAGNDPVNRVDPDGKWYSEFLTGQQSWSGDNGLQREIGQASQYLYDNSRVWNYAMENPVKSGVVVGVVGGLTAYGVATVITQAQIGINLGRLSELPMHPRVDLLGKGFDNIYKATSITKTEAIQLISNTGKSLVEMRPENLGNINNILNIGSKVIRITTNPSATKIISAGVITNNTKVANYVSSGAMRATPFVTSIAKTFAQFIINLVR